ncbi:DmsC/YnfH family molybdoenzyme membrane anchor subunit [Gordonibacter sp.]|uniref:DmsC/YnfH family molybdoenzyme membrane anchor subunit n=1 Tax=Gordonibacter sp. TaxID=1968902 RepID=UPI003FA5D585
MPASSEAEGRLRRFLGAFSPEVRASRPEAPPIACIASALARLGTASREEAVRIDRMCACPFSVCLVGFIASATHLGTPANALHVFWSIGRSTLSNEVRNARWAIF